LPPPAWGYAANYSREQDEMYGTTGLRVRAVIQVQTDDVAAAPAPTTFGEHMECLDIVPGISRMPPGTSQLLSSHLRLMSGKPQSNKDIHCHPPDAEPNLSLVEKVKPVEPISNHMCILPP